MNKLNYENIVEIHSKVIENYGGLDGVRDDNALRSSAEQIYQSFGEEELYPSIEEKIARLGYSIITNHPCLDGNKRTGFTTMLVMLDINNIEVDIVKVQQSAEFIENVAAGKISYEEVIKWIKDIII
ncbi:MAG: type II toxin-antitoxin system death-on-curing family toxin [Fusobacteriales bacterium]|nr:MAG: type II toxin-antitoxin system death-on-curing family toxin [Fusobacteriales bacterium]